MPSHKRSATMQRILPAVFIILLFFPAFRAVSQEFDSLQNIRVTVTFATPPTSFTVTKAPLRFNKTFAFSFQIDDGEKDIYTHAYPFLHGGTVAGTTYPGLKYTDGCGNDHFFKMSSSIYSFSSVSGTDVDCHEPSGPFSAIYVTWPQLIEMFQQGWGISNHGLTPGGGGSLEYEIARNHSYIKLKTQAATTGGFDPGIFVNPNGGEAFSAPAFSQGYLVCYREGYNFGRPSFDVTSVWNHSNIGMGRTNVFGAVNLSGIIDAMAAASINGAHHWGVTFTHSVTNGNYGYTFPVFQNHMNYIANTYGKLGYDNIWMTTEEEVLDYLLVNDAITVNTQLTGPVLEITFSGTLPDKYRFYNSTLLVNANTPVTSISTEGVSSSTSNGTGTTTSMINLTWNGHYVVPAEENAETWVSKTETTHSQEDANIAVDYILMVPEGPEQQAFRYRLCNVSGITLPTCFCPLPVPGTITGLSSVCAGAPAVTYSVPTITGASSYSWTYPSGFTPTAGQLTKTITFSVSPAAVSGNITVAGISSCGTGPVSQPLAVVVKPNPAPVITGVASVCETSTGVVYTTQPGMTDYTWSVSPGGTITSGGSPADNTITITWNTSGSQTVSVSFTGTNGCVSPAPTVYSVTVNPLPVPTLTGPASACRTSAGNVYTTQPGMAGYNWTVSSGGTITAGGTSGSHSVTVTWDATGPQTITVSYTNTNGCATAVPALYNVMVNDLPQPVISGAQDLCIGTTDAVYATETGMSGYLWSVSAGGIITSGGTPSDTYVNVTWNTAGAQHVAVNYTNANGCMSASPTLFPVAVHPLPIPDITGPSPICTGVPGNVYQTQPGMTGYSWEIDAGGTITAGGTSSSSTATVTWNTAGPKTIRVNYINENGCTATLPATFTATVNPLPVPVVSGPSSCCAATTGHVYTTQSSMTGYTWSVSPGGTITAGGTSGSNTATIDWNSAGPQTVGVGYTNANGCTANPPASYNVTVNPLPVPVINGASSVCVNSAGVVYATQNGMTGYNWTVSTGGTITAGGTSTSNTVTVTWNTEGAQTVSVGYTNGNGCVAASPTPFYVTVNPLPVPALSGPSPVCLNATGNIYTSDPGMTNYTWTVSPGGIITSGGDASSHTVTVTWIAAGLQSVSVNYTNSNGCLAAAATVYGVLVNPLPAPSLTGPAMVCDASSGNIYSTDPGMTGYTWALTPGGTITAGGTSTSNTAAVTWNGPGQREVFVNYTNENGCSATSPAALPVVVNPLPVPVITGNPAVCLNTAGNVYTTTAGMTNYNWVVSSGGIITAGGTSGSNTVTVTWGQPGQQSVSVVYTDAIGCTAPVPTVFPVTVNPLPLPTVTGPTPACEGSAGNVYTTLPGMNNYSWAVSSGGMITSGGSPVSNSATVTWNTVGPQQISVNYTDGNGCTAGTATSYPVSIIQLPFPVILGPDHACVGGPGEVYSTEEGMTGYLWSVSSAGTIVSGGTTADNTVTVTWNTAGPGTISVNYNDASGCTASASTIFHLTIHTRPVPTLTGPSAACAGSATSEYTTQAGMSNYSWTVSGGGTIIAGGTAASHTATVAWNTAGPQSVGVNYNNAEGCPALSPASFPVTVNPQPVPTIVGAATLCEGITGVVYATQAGMTNYDWIVSSGGVITSGGTSSSPNVTVTWIAAGNESVSVNYHNSFGCPAANPTVYPVTVNPLPVPAITGPPSVCVNSSGHIYTTDPGMNGYNWTLSPGGIILSGSSSASITVQWTIAGPQTVSVSYTNASGCTAASPSVYNVSVNPLPVPVITGSTSVCAGTAGVVYTTEAGMTSYTWTITSGGTITAGTGTNSITVTWDTPGIQTVSVNYINTNGCTAPVPVNLTVTVKPLPVPTITGNTSPCVLSGTYAYTTESGMTNYQWIVSPAGNIVSGAGTKTINVSWVAVGPQWVSVNYTSAEGCIAATPAMLDVNVIAVPGTPGAISGASEVCAGATGIPYSVDSVAYAASYLWTLPPGAAIASGTGTRFIIVDFSSNAEPGNMSVQGTNGCGGGQPSQPLPVNVVNIPAAPEPVSGLDTVALGATGVAYAVTPVPGATTYTWNLPPGATVTTGTGTSSISVDFSATASSGTISVFASNTCGDGQASPPFQLTITDPPLPPVITQQWDFLHSNYHEGNQWYLNGNPIPGATTQTYQGLTSGLYWDVVTIYGMQTDTSNHIQMVVTGTAERTGPQIIVSPNPGNGLFKVSVENAGNDPCNLTVINRLGVMVIEVDKWQATQQPVMELDLRNLPGGVYLLVIQNKTSKQVKNIVLIR